MHVSIFLLDVDDIIITKSHLINVLLLEEQSQTLPSVFEELWNIDGIVLWPTVRLCDTHWEDWLPPWLPGVPAHGISPLRDLLSNTHVCMWGRGRRGTFQPTLSCLGWWSWCLPWPDPCLFLEQAPGRGWPPLPFFPLPEERGAVTPPGSHSSGPNKICRTGPGEAASISCPPCAVLSEESEWFPGCRGGRERLGEAAGKGGEHVAFPVFCFSRWVYVRGVGR